MEFENAIEARGIKKKYTNFTLNIPELDIPKGFSTAIIGENGAGKTTLLNILAGTRLDFSGDLTFFGKYDKNDREKEPTVRELTGYIGTDRFFLPNWTVSQVDELSRLLYANYDHEKFLSIYDELAISESGNYSGSKKVSALSDGNKVKLALAAVLARETSLLIMDEPASPLDPLMREKLCDLIRDYIAGNPERSVLFSTHNISDMESVTDYAIIMEHGEIVEAGFVEDLKEKYIRVKGEAEDTEKARPYLYTITPGKYGFEGIVLKENLDKLNGLDIVTESANLFQISVAIMKKNTKVK